MPKISGPKGVADRLTRLAGQEKIALVGHALFVGGESIRAYAAHSITEGAVSGKNHVPSRPGEPPNEDTGHLRTNIDVTQTGPLRVEVASNAKYSAALEYGTSKMAARPFMNPAARAKRKEVTENVRKAISAAIRKG
jgi:HK97 gp10 family phage protein